MSNAERILRDLDVRLSDEVELTLYGRAALHLGYPDPSPEFAQSLDVDVVLWLGQAEYLNECGNFWDAVEQVNLELAGQRLYISHFFEESQVILTPSWREKRVPIPGAWRRLKLYRLGDEDLFLSKCMRYDPIDLADARFVWANAGWSIERVRAICAEARIPPIMDLKEQFERCINTLIENQKAES